MGTSRPGSLARQVLVLQLLVLAVVVLAGSALAVVDERRDADAAARREVIAVAESLAGAASTAQALRSPDPTAVLQPEAEAISAATGMDFIVVMAPDRTRYTHPDTSLIGKQFAGTIDRALAGEPFTETYNGSLGPSIRSVVPVYADGQVVGLVSAGVTRERIGEQFLRGLPLVLVLTAGALALAALGSALLSRRVRRQTLGLAPAELRALYEHHDAVLHSIHEGLLVFGAGSDTAEIVNDEARRLLALPDGPVTRADLPPSLRDLDSATVRGEIHLTGDRVLVVNQDAVRFDGRRIGTVITLRDQTELQSVTGELDSMRLFTESLRAQAHESANRLHTVVTMVELGRADEAVAFATAELELSQHLIDRLTEAVHDPALLALLLGKVNQATERGVDLTVTDDTALPSPAPLTARELLTVVGNLVDNAIDAASGEPINAAAGDATDRERPWVEVTVVGDDTGLDIRVADSGPGMTADEFAAASRRGYSTKDDHHGLGLALVTQVVTRHGGTVTTETTYGAVVSVRIPRRREDR
ncbi:ATP-binding protein [Rhodococcus sp. NPDC003318]|uniref:sensor histidine kinase n=1 Tax=Rhodococcus sp. NPDC003318 TaxID=3364503 RepID=UPI003681A90A